jgi:hypothetical protein
MYRNGYGQFRLTWFRDAIAHRWAYRISTGSEPGPSLVLHSCANRACCNPAHLRLGDHAENMRDMVRHGNSQRGELATGVKLTDSKVKSIRRLSAAGASHSELVARFGVSKAAVSLIVNRKRWAHVS